MTTYADQQDCIHLEPVEEHGVILDYLCMVNLDSGRGMEDCPCYEAKSETMKRIIHHIKQAKKGRKNNDQNTRDRRKKSQPVSQI